MVPLTTILFRVLHPLLNPTLTEVLLNPTLTKVLLYQTQLITTSWTMTFRTHHPNVHSDDPESEDEDEAEWTKEKMKPSAFSININGVDSIIEERFKQETMQVKENILHEYRAIGGDLLGE